ncbi:MAG: LptF/LptG family permease [Bacteroidales bacterium]|nr:LptF/LptG family permease [Bacteroidales bacterium]
MDRMRIRRIDRYIVRKFLGTFFYAITLLIMVVIIFDGSEKIDDFIEKDAPLDEILFQYYLNFIPYFINLFSPLFTFVAVIFFTSKMASRSEIVAILSSGVSFGRLLRPYLFSALVLALVSFFLANFVIPHTNRRLLNFEYTYLKKPPTSRDKDIHLQVRPGKFVYVESYNTELNTGHRFTLETVHDKEKGAGSKLSADIIRWDSLQQLWVLDNYFYRSWNGNNETLIRGARKDTVMEFRPEDFVINSDDMKLMRFWELREFIDKQKLSGNEQVAEYEVEKHKRIAFPFATLVLTLIGVALSSRKVRGGIGLHLGVGITLSFAFILFMQISTTFAVYGNFHAGLAVWLPNIFFGGIAAWLLRIAPK